MPEIARFYGIVIKLFFGDLPLRAKKLVIEWAKINKNELKEMWKNQDFHKLTPLN